MIDRYSILTNKQRSFNIAIRSVSIAAGIYVLFYVSTQTFWVDVAIGYVAVSHIINQAYHLICTSVKTDLYAKLLMIQQLKKSMQDMFTSK